MSSYGSFSDHSDERPFAPTSHTSPSTRNTHNSHTSSHNSPSTSRAKANSNNNSSLNSNSNSNSSSNSHRSGTGGGGSGRRQSPRYNSSSSSSESESDSASEPDDDFGLSNLSYSRFDKAAAGKLKTGRERRKKVARGKGGEFYEKRRKRRVYFCTLASEIDVGELKDHILDSNCAWQTRQLGDALILSKPISPSSNSDNYYIPRRAHATAASTGNIEVMLSERERSYISNKKSSGDYSRSHGLNHRSRGNSSRDKRYSRNHDNDRSQDVSDPRHKEVVVFEFGAIVLWGFSVGEESVILQTIKDFAADGQCLMASEFTASEDDMAFITHSPTSSVLELGLGLNLGGNETPGTTQDHTLDDDEEAERRPPPPEEEIDLKGTIIANDVISFPERTTCEHRLAVSYAIAQSSIVAIFEERIMQKVAEYKFIPETLASVGKIDLSTKRIGMMIGEIFVIRHDLNLHSDILDTPDFFWGEQDRYVDDYERVTRYLEMDSRVEVLNTRLNMLKDLLDVLNQQMENDHSTKLEWIIIWLIVIEVVIQLTSVGVTIMSDLSMIA